MLSSFDDFVLVKEAMKLGVVDYFHKPSMNETQILEGLLMIKENLLSQEFGDGAEKIVGYSAGKHKDAALVQRAFAMVKHPLETVKIFHTDRGSEFKNIGIDELLSEYGIDRSLSDKGNPYDNAVSETTFKILKTELVNDMHFETLEHLSLELFDCVNWYNNIRTHSTLGYLSPVTYRNTTLKKIV